MKQLDFLNWLDGFLSDAQYDRYLLIIKAKLATVDLSAQEITLKLPMCVEETQESEITEMLVKLFKEKGVGP